MQTPARSSPLTGILLFHAIELAESWFVFWQTSETE
jgi:hypothetical protein